jgi:hypothetical protein
MATRTRIIDKLQVVTEFTPPEGWEGGGGGAVDSVNGQTGVVVLDPDDLDDTSTTNKFATAAELTKLAGIETGAQVNIPDLLTVSIGDGVYPIEAGIIGYKHCPRAFKITQWTILGDVSGSIVVDVWKDTYANYPPTVADTIAGSDKPTLSSANKNQSGALSWTINAGDVLAFKVDSASTVTRVSIAFTTANP